MPVNSRNINYLASISQWRRCRDVLKGEDAIKNGGTLYLPPLDDSDSILVTGTTGKVLGDPNYEAYKERALFFGATKRTYQGVMGVVFRKSPQVSLGEKAEAETFSVTHLSSSGI